MERPNEPILDTLDAIISNIAAHEDRIRELKQRLREETCNLESVSDPASRLAAAVYAYWYMPDIHTEDLAWAVLKSKSAQHKFRELAGPVVTGINCDRCSERLPITSRTQMRAVLDRHKRNQAQYAEGYRAVCEPCSELIMQERRESAERRSRDAAAVSARLRQLPYADYLNTEHWRNRRAMYFDHLDWMHGRGSERRCDVCTRRDGLEVFHKTMASVAREGVDDLMLLCASCRDVLVEGGLIVPR